MGTEHSPPSPHPTPFGAIGARPPVPISDVLVYWTPALVKS